MKILQLIHKPQNRGAETFACQLSHHLTKLGHEVKIVAVYSGNAQLPYSPKIETLNGSTGKRIIDIPAWKNLSQIIKDFRPDILQANSGDTLKYAVLSKIFFKWNTPIISRNASEVGRYLNSFFQKKLNKFLYLNVDLVISVSQASKKDIISHFPFLSGKTEVIPVGLEQKSEIRAVELLPEGKKHIVHVGGFSFEKNHSGLLNILALVLQKQPDVHLHLIGDGPLREDIIKKVDDRRLSSKVSFYGFIPDSLPYIKSADILVLPSIIEGLPGVLLEAMYCRTPVIAYNVGGISEIIDSNTGMMIEKGEEKKFAHGVTEILDGPDVRQIELAHQMIVENFMNQHLALEFVKCYQKIKLL